MLNLCKCYCIIKYNNQSGSSMQIRGHITRFGQEVGHAKKGVFKCVNLNISVLKVQAPFSVKPPHEFVFSDTVFSLVFCVAIFSFYSFHQIATIDFESDFPSCTCSPRVTSHDFPTNIQKSIHSLLVTVIIQKR